jgi:hypothetical protein
MQDKNTEKNLNLKHARSQNVQNRPQSQGLDISKKLTAKMEKENLIKTKSTPNINVIKKEIKKIFERRSIKTN